MSLDLPQVVTQVQNLAEKLRLGKQEHEERLGFALARLGSSTSSFGALKARIEQGKTTWLVAGLVDDIASRHRLPSPLSEYAVIATDGSHIPLERHRPLRCYLINTGGIVLHYGAQPSSRLLSSPVLYFGDAGLSVVNPSNRLQREPIEGGLLGVKRSVEECHLLARLAKEEPGPFPTLCVLDGSLVLWSLAAQGYPEFVTRFFLQDGLLKAFDNIKQLSQGAPLSLASYISYPRSTEVINSLRVALCPHEQVDCDLYCAGEDSSGERACSLLDGLMDQELFFRFLDYGERSSLFASRSSVVERYYGEHSVYFFYLKVGDEIGRVEIPRWVAERPELVTLTHSIIFDQCERGRGYPVALSEAHERAVVTPTEREEFWRLVELVLGREKLPVYSSAKSFHKRARWI